MRVLTLHIATEPRLINTARPKLSGIHKTTVRNVDVDAHGLFGDHVVDTKHHGGPDQAVYVYAEDDYAWWRDRTGLDIGHGVFGENITVDSFGSENLMIGDRFVFGSATETGVILEATAARIPCDTFSARMARPDWIREFRDARRPGVYCRVINGGPLGTGDSGSIERHEGPTIPMLETTDLFYAATNSATNKLTVARLEAALASPICERSRASNTAALARLQRG